MGTGLRLHGIELQIGFGNVLISEIPSLKNELELTDLWVNIEIWIAFLVIAKDGASDG